MKTKKALKRLDEVESLLTDVMDELSGNSEAVHELLSSAKAKVSRAAKLLDETDSEDGPKQAAKKTSASPKKKGGRKQA